MKETDSSIATLRSEVKVNEGQPRLKIDFLEAQFELNPDRVNIELPVSNIMLNAQNLDAAVFMGPWPLGKMEICIKSRCDHPINGLPHAKQVDPHNGNLLVQRAAWYCTTSTMEHKETFIQRRKRWWQSKKLSVTDWWKDRKMSLYEFFKRSSKSSPLDEGNALFLQ
ncbi:hypothetical protein ARMGADRAFT_1031933 [Armillaria gallica]|uniref:Uncharacterized protein n=1 Tax=Armillaria gallica TaxID=47427 RepID=A0A2H3DSL5_ARMGA|nr:hypothetical protein ARMGADRAFT_1031933 [Armillaria gallica]